MYNAIEPAAGRHLADSRREVIVVKKIAVLIFVLCMVFAVSACVDGALPMPFGVDEAINQASPAPDAESDPSPSPDASHSPTPTTAPSPTPTPRPTPTPTPKPTPTPEPLPTANSGDVELYIRRPAGDFPYVVDRDGQEARRYRVDASGNILDSDGKMVVTAANAWDFAPLTALSFNSQSYTATLQAREEIVGNDANVTRVVQYPENVTLLVAGSPFNSTGKVIVIGTENRSIAEIQVNNNTAIMADGQYELANGEVAIKLDADGHARVVLTCKAAGTVRITARDLTNSVSASCVVTVQGGQLATTTTTPVQSGGNVTGIINPTQDQQKHVHSYTSRVVQPTATEQGYTEFTCACGDKYRDNYVPALGVPEPQAPQHVHSYNEIVYAPSATERGYTLHICSCGDSYKDRYTDPIQP